MFEDDPIERHFAETRQIVSSVQRKFWTAFKWLVGVVVVLVLAALLVAWKIRGG